MTHQQNIGENGINRRAAIGALGGIGALGVLQSALGAQDGDSGRGDAPGREAFDFHALGWDQAAGEYVLPKLPYDYNALEPHIDEQTMRIHHDKHHAGYVKGANKALTELARMRGTGGGGDQALIKHWARELSFHLGGHVNHTIFWHCMAAPAKGVGGEAWGEVGEAITRDFGSFNAFSAQFQAAANAVEGSGWGWLCYEPTARKLVVMQMEKQQDMLSANVRPILGVDVWEHAYYLKYQNKRSDYVAAFMNLINWNAVNALYSAASKSVTRVW